MVYNYSNYSILHYINMYLCIVQLLLELCHLCECVNFPNLSFNTHTIIYTCILYKDYIRYITKLSIIIIVLHKN